MNQTPAMRIIDASLNRASEGLRVVEDYVRFVLDDPFLTGRAKAIRHDLAAAAAAFSTCDRHAARETRTDVGTTISTDAEASREDAWSVCAASLKRTEQSLRSLEEYGKLVDGEFAGRIESLRYGVYTLEKAIDVGRSSRERLEGIDLCVLLSGGNSAGQFQRLVESLVEAGVGMIQLREKNLDDRELIGRARVLVERTRGSRTVAIVNDRADIAAAVGAEGVHLGQEDLSVKDARAIVGTRALIGVSTHNIEQARTAVLDGANYLGAGPTFASRTKNFDDFAGLDYLREVSSEIRLPTYAIGGISAENLPEVIGVGVSRVAVGSAVIGAKDPGRAAKVLLVMLRGSRVTPYTVVEATAPSLTSDV
jgi:thiamine-phosphate pyrophosphorylase